MTNETLTLTEFLLARIADDEALARVELEISASYPPPPEHSEEWGWHRIIRGPNGKVRASSFAEGAPSPARVLAECAAKRTVVEMADEFEDQYEGSGLRLAMDALATVYADHPDYRAEWSV